ncbi:MAG: 50S ribosomal protein L22 [Firmicutes bacterium]|nr:50S ribosomal protein L22 [Bacillota bacterium]
MEVFAHVKYVRMSPRKVKLVCDMIRGKDVKTAAAYLNATNKAACEPMRKLLKSAVANAENNNGLNADNLYISTCVANPGPTLKRGRIASRRGFVRILKRTTHISIGVSEKA